MRPPPASLQSGDNNLKHHQASPEHPATGSSGMPRARLAIRPPPQPHSGGICATRTQLRTQNTMGIGGGATTMRSTVWLNRHETAYLYHHLLSFLGPYFQAAPSENSTIGLITGGDTKEARGFAHKGILRWSSSMIVIPVLTYLHVACPWIGHVK